MDYKIPVNIGNISSFNYESKAEAIFLPEENNEWFTWRSYSKSSITIEIAPDESYINSEDWVILRDFINSEKRTKFKFELISRSFTLHGLSLRTNTLIDAVTALEIATSEFVRSPSIDQKKYNKVLKRLDVIHLDAAFRHLGYSKFILYVLPLILDEEVIENSEIRVIAKGIQSRNNIVHNGQRDIDKLVNIKYLVLIRKLILILDEFTDL